MHSGVVILIPAYRPSDALSQLVDQLRQRGAERVVIVDDGSGADYLELFQTIKERDRADYLAHPTNRGKGSALKTGFGFVAEKYPDAIGVVTADADGQHTAEDIIKLADRLSGNPSAMIMGSRRFAGQLPWRSRFGNTLTRKIFSRLTGQQVSDTQTGLRGIPADWLDWLITLPGERYEYEMAMLLGAKERGLTIVEEPISTVYEPGNRSSHFNPLIDSWRIYRVLLRPRRPLTGPRLVKLPPNYLRSIATVSDRMPKLYYHPIKLARDFFWLRLSVLAQLASEYAVRKDYCLDFACGSGIFLPTLSRMFKQVVGIDLEMTEAKQLAGDYQLPNVQLIEGDIATAELNRQFDAIFSADVLEHFSDLQLPVRQLKQWLGPEGVLLTSLPTENWLTRLTRIVGGYKKPWDHYHTGREVENFLTASGFIKIASRIVVPLFPLYYLGVWRKR